MMWLGQRLTRLIGTETDLTLFSGLAGLTLPF
jgi:hypothetical protein